MKKMITNVTFRGKRPYIKDTSIPVELLVGLSLKEVKKNYPWLSEEQIEDALNFIKRRVNNVRSASPETSISPA